MPPTVGETLHDLMAAAGWPVYSGGLRVPPPLGQPLLAGQKSMAAQTWGRPEHEQTGTSSALMV